MEVTVNLIVLIGQFILAGFLVWVALRKVPAEKSSLNGSASNDYMQAAHMAGEELVAYKKQTDATIAEMLRQIKILQNKKFDIHIEFEIGDPPTVGKVEVKPIVTDSLATRPSMKKPRTQ
jgi:hypothetical protein